MKTIKLSAEAKAIIGTRKTKVFIAELPAPYPTGMNTASYWDGGSRRSYSVLNLATGAQTSPPSGSYPHFDAHYHLKAGEVMIQTGVFCGKPATPSLTFIKEDAARVAEVFHLPELLA